MQVQGEIVHSAKKEGRVDTSATNAANAFAFNMRTIIAQLAPINNNIYVLFFVFISLLFSNKYLNK